MDEGKKFQWGHLVIDVETYGFMAKKDTRVVFQWGHVVIDVETLAMLAANDLSRWFQWGHVVIDVETHYKCHIRSA